MDERGSGESSVGDFEGFGLAAHEAVSSAMVSRALLITRPPSFHASARGPRRPLQLRSDPIAILVNKCFRETKKCESTSAFHPLARAVTLPVSDLRIDSVDLEARSRRENRTYAYPSDLAERHRQTAREQPPRAQPSAHS